jgi:hypothetical protein
MDSVVGFIAVALSFPVSFLLARGFLRGVIRLVTGPQQR